MKEFLAVPSLALGGAVNDAVETPFAGTSSPEAAAQAIEETAAFELQ